MKFSFASLALAASTILATPSVAKKPYCPSRPATRAQQRAIFNEMLDTMLVSGTMADAARRHYAEDYIQHDPNVLSGRDAIVEYLENQPPGFNSTPINYGLDGDYAYLLLSVKIPEQEEMAWTDIWRFDGTCVVEHWSVYMTKPSNAINPLPLL
ncbi:hypothetical protein F66182_2555 [Fusarium sp. NRRL 66182]|nr:hypothetical protein F66182_2555 [Fusarium sp. NRRL 66182]